jgi:hypothetical protein
MFMTHITPFEPQWLLTRMRVSHGRLPQPGRQQGRIKTAARGYRRQGQARALFGVVINQADKAQILVRARLVPHTFAVEDAIVVRSR